MKHDELWNDLLRDALPPGASAAALDAMRSEARRQRARRRTIRVCGSIALVLTVILTASLWTKSGQPPDITSLPALQHALAKIETHQLTDAELVARLDDAGFGIVIATERESRRLLLVSHEGAVYSP